MFNSEYTRPVDKDRQMPQPAPIDDIPDTLRRVWDDARPQQQLLLAIGTLLIAAGVIHLVPAVFGDRPWQGPISFRKPVVFGVSFGLTCVTFAWLLGYLRVSRRWSWIVAIMLGASSVIEVGLVSLQAFRGVPSHFNINGTGFDAAVFNAMGVTVAIVACAILLVTVWSFTRLEAPAPLLRGIRAGLLLLLASQALGGHLVTHGVEQVANQTGQPPNVFGAAGMLKVPHAVTLHAVQVLPGIAWLLGLSGWSLRRQRSTVTLATAGYSGITGVAVLQAFSGRAPFDLTVAAGGLLALSAGALATAAVGTLAALAQRRPHAHAASTQTGDDQVISPTTRA